MIRKNKTAIRRNLKVNQPKINWGSITIYATGLALGKLLHLSCPIGSVKF